MKPRITVITIGVDDLERSLHFYRDGLGLFTEGIVGRNLSTEPLSSSSYSQGCGLLSGRVKALHMTQDFRKIPKARPNLLWVITSVPRRKSMRL